MTATQAPTPGPLPVEITYEVYQDGDFCASSTRLQDAEHYANLYGQDGPVKCQTVVSVRHDDFLLPGDARLAPTAPVEASGSERTEDALEALDWIENVFPGQGDTNDQGVTVRGWQRLDQACATIRTALSRPQPSGETRQAVARLKERVARWTGPDYLGDERLEVDDALDLADDILALLSARPLALGGQQGVQERCQRCGGEVQGWLCQSCPAEFRENDDGHLVFDEDTTPARAEAQDEGAMGEPVAGWTYETERNGIRERYAILNHPNGKANPPTRHHGEPIFNLRTLYAHPSPTPAADDDRVRKFSLGDRVEKTKGSAWHGRVVGFYSTSLTQFGYAVESEREPGSVQIYPEAALKSTAAKEGGE